MTSVVGRLANMVGDGGSGGGGGGGGAHCRSFGTPAMAAGSTVPKGAAAPPKRAGKLNLVEDIALLLEGVDGMLPPR